MSNFLENRHPVWTDKKSRWEFTWDNYTGEYAKHDRVKLYSRTKRKNLESFDEYLHRKVQAETVEAYMERIMTSDPVMIFPTAIDSLNGIAYAGEDDTVRDFGDLGRVEPLDEKDTEYKTSIAYKLWHDADGNGTNWLPLMKQMGIKLTTLHRVWGLVDGIKEQEFDDGETEVVGEATVHIIDPQAVVDWFPSKNPDQVLVKESADMRSSIYDTDSQRDKDTYMLYELDGWKRFVDVEGNAEIIDEGEYAFYTDETREQRCLPIFPVEIPMPRDVGYLLAIKQNHLFNAKSIRDFSVRNMSFAFLQIVADEKQYEEIMANIKKGFRVMRLDPDTQGSAEHGYKAPPSDYLAEAGKILDKDKEDFAESAFKTYGDAAKQVTATEIRQESRSGVEAFLSLLVTSLDEFENHAMFLLEQVYFPEEPSRWGNASVERSQDFAPKDVDEALQKVSSTITNLRRVNSMSVEAAVDLVGDKLGWDDERKSSEVESIRNEMGALEVPNNMVGA